MVEKFGLNVCPVPAGAALSRPLACVASPWLCSSRCRSTYAAAACCPQPLHLRRNLQFGCLHARLLTIPCSTHPTHSSLTHPLSCWPRTSSERHSWCAPPACGCASAATAPSCWASAAWRSLGYGRRGRSMGGMRQTLTMTMRAAC